MAVEAAESVKEDDTEVFEIWSQNRTYATSNKILVHDKGANLVVWELTPQAGDNPGEKFVGVEVPGTTNWVGTPTEDLWPAEPEPRELQWTDVANRIMQYVPDYKESNSPRYIYGTNSFPAHKYWVAGSITDIMKPYDIGESKYELTHYDRAVHSPPGRLVTKPPFFEAGSRTSHWNDHQNEFFSPVTNEELYEATAQEWLYGKPNLKYFRRMNSGDIVIYDSFKNYFIAVDNQWRIMTFFRPDNEEQYFNDDKNGLHDYPPAETIYQ